ncbi:hypothetical protein GGH12_004550 [Coemansia sp. RSA 1822]|nr:hypothetical protein LPJ76_004066 [Coemansia sp. RSA 638]KAJ2541141.1 hypothetical protein GGF49_003907 [Coemansia sp. RSA 1853]KAJ2560764.1 hypothetical protein GGH12_004550 [Coemansia sp. RSA 1822]
MLNKCLANADYRCIQELPLQSSWVYGHVPMDTQILVHHILKEQYKPVTDKRPAVSTKKPAASDDKSAASTVEQVRFTDEEYWAKVVDLKLRVFKDHSQHTFNQFILTDGVSLCVVRRTVEATLAKKAAGEKRKRNRLAQQAQQTQPVQPPVQQAQLPLQLVAQQAWMSTGPPVRLPMVTPAQQAWIPMVTPVQQTWMPTGPPMGLLMRPMGPPVQQARPPAQPSARPMGLPAQLSVRPMRPPGQPTVPPDQPAQPVQRQRKKADCKYISELSQATLQNTVGRCVLVDPGRRDLLFAMREDSSIAEKKVYRYTRCQQRVETKQKKYKKILQQVKTAEVAAAERTLSAGSCTKPDLKLFEEYLRARADVAAKLTWFYNHTMSRQRDGATTPEVPIHWKLRLSGYIKRQQADQRLVKQLRAKFKPKESDPEPVFIMGNWSAPMTWFHEPIRGKGWRTLLKRGGFDVYLIDKYLTSKTCPNCFVDVLFTSEFVRDQISGTYSAYDTDQRASPMHASIYDETTLAELKQREIQAIAAAEQGQVDDAIRQLTDIIVEYPSYASAYNNRAQAYRLQSASSSMVIADLDCAIKCAHDNQTLGQAYTQKAIVLKALGNQDDAFFNFSQGAKCGNSVAKTAASKENPYAKLCGQMVSQAMKQLHTPSTSTTASQ